MRSFKLILATAGFLIGGIMLIWIGVYLSTPAGTEGHSFANVAYTLIIHLGMALTIAAVIALFFESLLTEERLKKVINILTPWKEAADAGFSRVYSSRKDAFEHLIFKAIPDAQSNIRVMGICGSLFREAQKAGDRDRDEQVVSRFKETLIHRMISGCKIDVLFLTRYPTDRQKSSYGLQDRDLYYWRERDEDSADISYYQKGKRLKAIANDALGHWIEVLVGAAERIREKLPIERSSALANLSVVEYLALPTVSVYIVDDSLFVTPYLFARHCADVPTYGIVGQGSSLFKEYRGHFQKTMDDDLSMPAIPPEFVELLAKNPETTLPRYRKALEDLKAMAARGDATVSEFDDIDNRIPELAIMQVLGKI